MKLVNAIGWYARVNVELEITEDVEHGFPLNIGAVTITSKDGKRNYVLDSSSTDFINPVNEGEKFTFESRLDEDFETFPKDEENNYELLVEDLEDATAVFYCSRCNMEKGDFDFDSGKFEITFYLGEKEVAIKMQVEE